MASVSVFLAKLGSEARPTSVARIANLFTLRFNHTTFIFNVILNVRLCFHAVYYFRIDSEAHASCLGSAYMDRLDVVINTAYRNF